MNKPRIKIIVKDSQITRMREDRFWKKVDQRELFEEFKGIVKIIISLILQRKRKYQSNKIKW